MADMRIETPRDLDAAAKALNDALRSMPSPQLQLHALIAFFDRTVHLPMQWRMVYLLPHRHTLLRLLLHPYTQGHQPQLWASAWQYLRIMQGSEGEHIDLKQAESELLCKGVLAHAYVADLRKLHVFLRQAGVTVRDFDEREWRRIYGAGPAPFAVFDTYCAAQQDVLDAHHPLYAAQRRWSAWLSHRDAVSVVLLEEQEDTQVAGAVLRMEIASRRRGGGMHINNVLGADADLTRTQLIRAGAVAAAFAQAQLGYRFEGRELYFQIIDLHTAFSGGSLGLAATVGLACHLSEQVNGRVRWALPADTACVASLDAAGSLESVPWETIRRKIRLAFFSPLRRIVIPVEHVEAATRHVQELQRDYPSRSFEVYSALSFEDCFRPGHVVETTARNPYDRAQSFARRHARSSVLLFAALFLLAAAVLFYQTLFVFPDLEETMGITVAASAIVHNPHDSLEWVFRDGTRILPAEVSFGDIEVGDGFSRTLMIYNMTPGTKEVFLSIEGRDAAQWYVNSGGGAQLLESTVPREISVMYAPTAPSLRHEAALVLRESQGGEEYFRLALSGASGRAMPGGYALRLGSGPAYMTWGKNGLAFTNGELTIESWVRSLSWNGCFLHNGYNTPLNLERANLTISFADGKPRIALGTQRFDVPLATPMKPNQWHHIALAYSVHRPAIRFFLDGDLVFERNVPFALQDRMSPFVSLGAYADSLSVSGFLDCEVDNFRLWWKLFDETDIERTKHETLAGTVPGLKANFDMESNSDITTFNGSGESPDAELLYRPAIVRSTAPLQPGASLPQLTVGPRRIPAVQLPAGTYLHFARQLLPSKSDATFTFWWQTGPQRSTAMAVRNLGHFVSFSSDTIATSYSGCRSDIIGAIPAGWHHVAVRVLADGRKEIFIDGQQRAALESCLTPGADYHDWHHRYDGISFGVFDDRYHMFSARMHGTMREALAQNRHVADIAIWRRLLANEEIATLAAGADPPPDQLAAYWRFDHAPTGDLNFIDKVDGQLLHIKSAPAFR